MAGDMTLEHLSIPGLVLIRPRVHWDQRGSFRKIFHADHFTEITDGTMWKEAYLSTTANGSVRGLHFQVPPVDHWKLVTCTAGTLFDAVVDLRRSSASYGRHVTVELDAERGEALLIPRGLAHGFTPVSARATMLYLVETVHNPVYDRGIRWDSCGISWPIRTAPVISSRDRDLPSWADFTSPFP